MNEKLESTLMMRTHHVRSVVRRAIRFGSAGTSAADYTSTSTSLISRLEGRKGKKEAEKFSSAFTPAVSSIIM